MTTYQIGSPMQDLGYVLQDLRQRGVHQVVMEIQERHPLVTRPNPNPNTHTSTENSFSQGSSTRISVPKAVPPRTTVLNLWDINEEMLCGFWSGEDLVYPDLSRAHLNPFLKSPILTIPCHRPAYTSSSIVQAQIQGESQVQSTPSKVRKVAHSSTIGNGNDIKSTAGQLASLRNLPMSMSMPVPVHMPISVHRPVSVPVTCPLNNSMPGNISEGEGSGKSSKKGTSCHQCKNTKRLGHLAYCSKTFDKRSKNEKRTCRKKFCQLCLSKFYKEDMRNVMEHAHWVCPSCRGECVCAACLRGKQPGEKGMKKEQENTCPSSLEPTSS